MNFETIKEAFTKHYEGDLKSFMLSIIFTMAQPNFCKYVC
jgi:hypothetical protein